MKTKVVILSLFLAFTMLMQAHAQAHKPAKKSADVRYIPEPYVPRNKALYNTISQLDSIYFDTYNTCNIGKMDSLTSADLEFYHDSGGLMTSKKEYLESIERNICGKVTRKLAKGSIEVYEIPGFGAVEEGYHSFYNRAEASESHPSKFIIIWRLKDGNWQITRVVSLH